jgi:hypothetical protein
LQPFQINQGLITEEEFYEWLKKLKNSKLKWHHALQPCERQRFGQYLYKAQY